MKNAHISEALPRIVVYHAAHTSRASPFYECFLYRVSQDAEDLALFENISNFKDGDSV